MRLLRLALTSALVASASPRVLPGQEVAVDPSPFQVARVERFLDARVACRGCHVIAGRGGGIGPVLDGIATRSDRATVLAMIRNPVGTVPGTIMPLQPMPASDAERLTSYLLSLPSSPSGDEVVPMAPAALDPDRPQDGASLYARHCAACHGETGRGDGWNAQTLPTSPTAHASAELMSQRPDDTLFDGIAGGGYVLDKSPLMPAFGRALSAVQIRALVEHIRDLCDCEQPAWARGRG